MHTLTTEQGTKIQVTDEQYAQLVPNHEKWRAEKRKNYFFLNNFGFISDSIELNSLDDSYRYLVGNYYSSFEEAEQALAYQKALGTITHAIYERNAGWEADWKNQKQDKWSIWRNNIFNIFAVSPSNKSQEMHNFYCATKEIAESIIKDFPEELKVVFNVK